MDRDSHTDLGSGERKKRRIALVSGFRGVSAWRVVRQIGHEIYAGNSTDIAAQLSYYFLFALFPLLFFIVSMAAYLPLGGAVDDLVSRMRDIMPVEAMRIIEEHLQSLVSNQRPKLLSLGLVLALWTASRAVDAFRRALNLAYDVTESRSYLRTQVRSLLMTLVGTVGVVVSFALILLGGKIGLELANRLTIGPQFILVWGWLRWPISALVIMLAVALLYYVLPDVKQEFMYITPGSVAATLLWLVCTYGFTVYVEHFGNYNATYGSIGGVIVLMTWLYLSGLIFLLGGKTNAIIEHESASGKDRGAREKGGAPLPASQRPSTGVPVDAPMHAG